jgi:hypothetical protein
MDAGNGKSGDFRLPQPLPVRWFGRGAPEELQLASYQRQNLEFSTSLHLYLLRRAGRIIR